MPKKEKDMPVSISILYPEENEVITYYNYTIKIATNSTGKVEISIDAGNWQLCRQSDGFWWYDWANYPKGKHRIAARTRDDKGNLLGLSEVRKCVY